MKRKTKLGQSILGFVFAFIMLAALAVGLTRIWAWFNINLGVRQVKYQGTRLEATRPELYDAQNVNKYLAARPIEGYAPLDLTEDWIFKGTPSGTVAYTPSSGTSFVDPAVACKNQCFNPNCQIPVPSGSEGCRDCQPAATQGTFTPDNCLCFKKCMCLARVQPQLAAYDAQKTSLIGSAAQLRDEADDMRAEARGCKDPWHKCWWAGFGLMTKKLNEAAKKLDAEAGKMYKPSDPTSLDTQVGTVTSLRNKTEACCSNPRPGQEVTAQTFEHDKEICCDELLAWQCPSIELSYLTKWRDYKGTLEGEIDTADLIRAKILQLPTQCAEYARVMVVNNKGGNQAEYFAQCAQSFSCGVDANGYTVCCFGVLDNDYHGYTKTCQAWVGGDGNIYGSTDCCECTLTGCRDATPGRWGDGCEPTWNSWVPRFMATYEYRCWYTPASPGDKSEWWNRNAYTPLENCDEDCEVSPGGGCPATPVKCGLKGGTDCASSGPRGLYERQCVYKRDLEDKKYRYEYDNKFTTIGQCCGAWADEGWRGDDPEIWYPSRCSYLVDYRDYSTVPPSDTRRSVLIEGLKHSECQRQCMDDADNIGESVAVDPLEGCQTQCDCPPGPSQETCILGQEACLKGCMDSLSGMDRDCYQDCQELHPYSTDEEAFRNCLRDNNCYR